MAFIFRIAATVLLSTYARSRAQDCGDDPECALNTVQLLQQDLNLQKTKPQVLLQDGDENGYFNALAAQPAAAAAAYAIAAATESAARAELAEPSVQLLMADSNARAAGEVGDTGVQQEDRDFEAEEYALLKELEKNLTDAVHAQAIVVSTATDKLVQAEALDGVSQDNKEAALDDLEDAKLREARAAGRSDLLAIALIAKKAERDMLENATAEANKTLNRVKPKYLAAEAAYNAALGPIPIIMNNADDAQAEYEEAQAELDAAEYTQDVADAAVDNETMRLQREIFKLNTMNEKLRDVQGELDRPLPPST